jgi:cysteinyl-tRNA synthetase
MAETLLGTEFEIHGGGIDLIFPHHENEIAQTEGARERPLAKIWMHNEMLELGGDKMSKSEGNIALLADVLDRWPAEVVVTYFLTSHYRSKLPFSDARLEDARKVVTRLREALRALDAGIAHVGTGYDTALAAAVQNAREDFDAALADDFGTPGAFAALFGIVKAVNVALAGDGPPPASGQLREVRHLFVELLDVLGISGIDSDGGSGAVPTEVMDLLEQRQYARAGKDFAESDRLRDEIRALGWEIRDSPEGPQVFPA